MLHSIEMGWYVLNKYYSLTDSNPVYAAAILLHPTKRMKYLKRNWQPEWYKSALESTLALWDKDYKNSTAEGPRIDPSQQEVTESQQEEISAFDNLLRDLQGDSSSDNETEDDLYNFIHSKQVIIDCHPLQWWCREDVRRRYPCLSHMAIDLLSIPPSSAEPERTFSGARRTASWDRLRITCSSIELVECIGNWLRTGIITKQNGSRGLIDVDIEGYNGRAADSDVEGDN